MTKVSITTEIINQVKLIVRPTDYFADGVNIPMNGVLVSYQFAGNSLTIQATDLNGQNRVTWENHYYI